MSYITQEGWRSLNFEVFISILLMRPKRKEGVSLVGSKFVLNVKKKHYSNSKIRTLTPLLISLYVFYIKSESISSPEQNYFGIQHCKCSCTIFVILCNKYLKYYLCNMYLKYYVIFESSLASTNWHWNTLFGKFWNHV